MKRYHYLCRAVTVDGLQTISVLPVSSAEHLEDERTATSITFHGDIGQIEIQMELDAMLRLNKEYDVVLEMTKLIPLTYCEELIPDDAITH